MSNPHFPLIRIILSILFSSAFLTPAIAQQGIVVYKARSFDKTARTAEFASIEGHPVITRYTLTDGKVLELTQAQLIGIVPYPEHAVGTMAEAMASIQSITQRFPGTKPALAAITSQWEAAAEVQKAQPGIANPDLQTYPPADAPVVTISTLEGHSHTGAIKELNAAGITLVSDTGVISIPFASVTDDTLTTYDTFDRTADAAFWHARDAAAKKAIVPVDRTQLDSKADLIAFQTHKLAAEEKARHLKVWEAEQAAKKARLLEIQEREAIADYYDAINQPTASERLLQQASRNRFIYGE